jgi:hypothetical protein
MHRACFLRWEHRAAFVATYNATGGGRMQADGTIREAFLSRVADAVIDKIVAFENRFRRRRG